MKTYQSHKVVEAGQITTMVERENGYSVGVDDESEHIRLTKDEGQRIMRAASDIGVTVMQGYLMAYKDGYISWAPNHTMEDYCEIGSATFSIALEGIKRGERWTRRGWNGPGQWIAAQIPDQHSKMGAPYIYISPVGGKLVPWLASQGDMLAEDWVKVG